MNFQNSTSFSELAKISEKVGSQSSGLVSLGFLDNDTIFTSWSESASKASTQGMTGQTDSVSIWNLKNVESPQIVLDRPSRSNILSDVSFLPTVSKSQGLVVCTSADEAKVYAINTKAGSKSTKVFVKEAECSISIDRQKSQISSQIVAVRVLQKKEAKSKKSTVEATVVFGSLFGMERRSAALNDSSSGALLAEVVIGK